MKRGRENLTTKDITRKEQRGAKRVQNRGKVLPNTASMPNILFWYSPPSIVSKTQSRRVHEETQCNRETNSAAGVTDDIGGCSAEGNNTSMEVRKEYIEIKQFLMLLYPQILFRPEIRMINASVSSAHHPSMQCPASPSQRAHLALSLYVLHISPAFEFLHSSGLYHDLDAFQWYMRAHASSLVLLEHILIMSIFLFSAHWHAILFCV